MIPAAAPNPDRLIALLRQRAQLLQAGWPQGFAEGDPDRTRYSSARGGRSAKGSPQHCGKAPAGSFNVHGLIHWLRQKFPQYTAVNVAAATGISSATVENWLHGRSQPSIEHFALMLMTFGPSFLRAAMQTEAPWIVKAEADAIAAEIEAEIERLERRRAAVLLEKART